MQGNNNIFGGPSWYSQTTGSRELTLPIMSGARLSAAPAGAVPVSDGSSGSLYLTAYTSKFVPIPKIDGGWTYGKLPKRVDSNVWESKLDISSTGLNVVAGTTYDVFGYVGANGFVEMSLESWSSPTARKTGSLIYLDGIPISGFKNGHIFLGTFYCADDDIVYDLPNQRLLWNTYNRVHRHFSAIDTTNSWTYTTAAWREQNNASSLGVSRVSVCIGLEYEPVDASQYMMVHHATHGGGVGIGIDSSTVNSALNWGTYCANKYITTNARYIGYPGLGFHTIRALEYGYGTGTNTWYGDTGVVYMQTGLNGYMWG